MSKDAFDKIADGLNEALATTRGEGEVMESMVEKIAGAILKHLLSGGEYVKDLGYGLIKVDQCLDLQEISRVALKAMREPTDAMIDSGCAAKVSLYPAYEGEKPHPTAGVVASAAYTAMIDAALKETT